MYIQNRHKKLYSEKLFNELCIIYMLMDNDNTLDCYVLDKRFNISKRTLYRYIEEINDHCPFLNLHFEGKQKHKYLTASLPEDYYGFELSQHIISVLTEKDISKDRLCRCILLIAKNMYTLENENDLDEEDKSKLSENDYVTVDGQRYVFNGFISNTESPKKTSLRTQQRDVKLVKDVLLVMELSE